MKVEIKLSQDQCIYETHTINLTKVTINLTKVMIYLLTSCNTEERIAQNYSLFGIAGGQEVNHNLY